MDLNLRSTSCTSYTLVDLVAGPLISAPVLMSHREPWQRDTGPEKVFSAAVVGTNGTLKTLWYSARIGKAYLGCRPSKKSMLQPEHLPSFGAEQ
jgi:hypothetical protein